MKRHRPVDRFTLTSTLKTGTPSVRDTAETQLGVRLYLPLCFAHQPSVLEIKTSIRTTEGWDHPECGEIQVLSGRPQYPQ